MTPTELAPSFPASTTSSDRVCPQNFSSGTTSLLSDRAEFTNEGGGIDGARQARANEHGVCACGSGTLDVSDGGHPVFSHGDAIPRNQRQNSIDRRRIDLERLKIAVVDPDDGAAGGYSGGHRI